MTLEDLLRKLQVGFAVYGSRQEVPWGEISGFLLGASWDANITAKDGGLSEEDFLGFVARYLSTIKGGQKFDIQRFLGKDKPS